MEEIVPVLYSNLLSLKVFALHKCKMVLLALAIIISPLTLEAGGSSTNQAVYKFCHSKTFIC